MGSDMTGSGDMETVNMDFLRPKETSDLPTGMAITQFKFKHKHIESRVPTQIVLSNSLCFPCVFPVQSQIFPVPISIICDYYFWEKKEIFAANIAISFTFGVREFTT